MFKPEKLGYCAGCGDPIYSCHTYWALGEVILHGRRCYTLFNEEERKRKEQEQQDGVD